MDPKSKLTCSELISARHDDENAQDPAIKNETREYATGKQLTLIVVGLILVLFMNMLDSTIIGTAIPRITTEFDSLNDVGWYGGAYLMAMCAVQLPWGKIFELFESKRSFLVTLIIFLVGSTVCASARSSAALIVGRAIAGVGAGGFQSSMLSILNASAPLAVRPKLIGITLGFGSIGLLLGPVLGGVFTQAIGWRYCFWLNLPIGAVIFVAVSLLRLPNAQSMDARDRSVGQRIWDLDPMGCLAWAGSISLLLLALNTGGTKWSWGSPAIACILAAAGVLFLYLLAWEHHRRDRAMLSIRILRHKRVAAAAFANLCMAGAFYAIAYFLPIYFQAVKGASPSMSGVYSLASVLAQMATSIFSGWTISKTGHFTPLMIIGSAIGVVAMSLLAVMDVNSTVAHFTGYQILLGVARGLTIQPPLNTLQVHLPTKDIPVASSLVMFCQNFGGSVGITAGQAIFAEVLRKSIRNSSTKLSPDAVINAGPLNFRAILAPDDIRIVIQAYSKATTSAFFLSVAGIGITLLASFGFGWSKLEQKRPQALSTEPSAINSEIKDIEP